MTSINICQSIPFYGLNMNKTTPPTAINKISYNFRPTLIKITPRPVQPTKNRKMNPNCLAICF